MYDLIIIGSGPAGLTAAIYATRAKLDFIIIEQNFMSGGQVVNTYEVDNYPATPGINGMDLSMKMREHAEGLGAVFVTEAVTSVDLTGDVKKVVTMDNEYEAKTVILATGAEHRKLGIPGELELAGMGVSYCATCDGAFFRGKDVAVVGGGDVAVEDAIFLARLCNKVYVIHRRDELRAAKVLQDRLLSLPNVEMCWSYHAKSIEGEGGMVTKLRAARIAGAWIGFSALLLLAVGWGAPENGMILYTLYFGWAFAVLLFRLLQRAAEKLKFGLLTPLVTCTIVVLLGWINFRGIGELLAFAFSCYPG